jgi:hypothetical protein
MPNDVKAILSVVTLLVGIGYAFWERSSGNAGLFWFVIIFAVFAVVAMWVFPEATTGKPRSEYDEPRPGSK